MKILKRVLAVAGIALIAMAGWWLYQIGSLAWLIYTTGR